MPSFDWGSRVVSFARLALKVVTQNVGNFLTVILLYQYTCRPSCSRRLIYSRTCFHCCHVRFLYRHSKHLVFRSSFIAFDRILTFTSVNRTTFLPAFALHQNVPLFALWLLIYSPYYFSFSVCFQISDSVILFFDMCVCLCVGARRLCCWWVRLP